MQTSDLPVKFPIPFANAADGTHARQVPTPSVIPTSPGAASLTDGFPPLTFLPIASGGVPPFGADMNGLLRQATAWARWQAAGGTVVWDSAFASAIGGYPLGSRVRSTTTGIEWLSVTDNNTTNPDAGGAGWIRLDGYYVDTSSAANTVVISTTVVPALFAGLSIRVKVAVTSTSTATLTFAGLGNAPIYRNGRGLGAGDLRAGSVYAFTYHDGAWEMQSPAGGAIVYSGTATLPASGLPSANVSVTFPAAFPVAVDHISLTPRGLVNSSLGYTPICLAGSVTLSSFVLSGDTNTGTQASPVTYNQTVPVYWRAEGH